MSFFVCVGLIRRQTTVCAGAFIFKLFLILFDESDWNHKSLKHYAFLPVNVYF